MLENSRKRQEEEDARAVFVGRMGVRALARAVFVGRMGVRARLCAD